MFFRERMEGILIFEQSVQVCKDGRNKGETEGEGKRKEGRRRGDEEGRGLAWYMIREEEAFREGEGKRKGNLTQLFSDRYPYRV
jgi:hypothetical protein